MKENGARIGEARFALLMTGTDLPIAEAETLLDVKPTRVIHAGEIINQVPEVRAVKDEWVHAIQLHHPMGDEPALNELLSLLADHRDELKALAARCQVTLRLYVQSDYAQVNYLLSEGTLKRLAELGLPLEVSTLSWGETGL